MTMLEDQTQALIWKYIDETCTASEKAEIEIVLAQNPEARKRHQELVQLDSTLSSQLIQAAPQSITQSILAKVKQDSTIQPATFKIVPLMLFVLVLLGLTASFLPSAPLHSMPPIDWSIFYIDTFIPQGYLVYILGALAAVGLIWFDYIFKHRTELNLNKQAK